jgi:hypothetical protein
MTLFGRRWEAAGEAEVQFANRVRLSIELVASFAMSMGDSPEGFVCRESTIRLGVSLPSSQPRGVATLLCDGADVEGEQFAPVAGERVEPSELSRGGL